MCPTESKILVLILLLLNGCIVQFIPETNEDPNLLVVEGLITDQNRSYTVKLSKSSPVGAKLKPIPVKNSAVSITDDLGNIYLLIEKKPGTYMTDSLRFRGEVGRSYTLHIQSYGTNYESTPMEMKPVPPIDSIYYEKVRKETQFEGWYKFGCQIYLNSFDPTNSCDFYRWEYVETWKFTIPFYLVQNRVCWASAISNKVYIKSTSNLTEDRITKFPLNYISDETDRLLDRYSILVNQYSVSEEEYTYWEKLQKVSESVGGLYDVTPLTIPSNIQCLENQDEKVLGYFSVSAVKSKRIFIDDISGNYPDLYKYCAQDIASVGYRPQGLNTTVWIIDQLNQNQVVLTYDKGCADCTVRGTKIKPDYWTDY